MELEQIWPPYALRIRTGDMELSPVRESDYGALAECASGGVRVGNVEAFLVDWDSGTDEQLARSIAVYQWTQKANFSVDDWTIEFTVRVNDRIVGLQGASAVQFRKTRALTTGSWLAKTEQGKGYGTRMRHAVISAFAEHFGAKEFHTAFIHGNNSSRKVSERLGYRGNGEKTIVAQHGNAVRETQLRAVAEDIPPIAPPLEVSGVSVMQKFLGLRDG